MINGTAITFTTAPEKGAKISVSYAAEQDYVGVISSVLKKDTHYKYEAPTNTNGSVLKYNLVYDSTAEKDIKGEAVQTGGSINFFLTGAANTAGDWSKCVTAPTVELKYYFTEAAEVITYQDAGAFWSDTDGGFMVGAVFDPRHNGIVSTATAVTSAKLGDTDVTAKCSVIEYEGSIWIKAEYGGDFATAYDAGARDLKLKLNDGSYYSVTL